MSGWSFVPDHTGGAYIAPVVPLAGAGGDTLSRTLLDPSAQAPQSSRLQRSACRLIALAPLHWFSYHLQVVKK